MTPLIIEGSLKENLLYGNNSSKTDEEMMKLIKEFELFNNEERGLDTIIDENLYHQVKCRKYHSLDPLAETSIVA